MRKVPIAMRMATAGDEILPLKDPRVQANQAYLVVVLLSRVITRLGAVSSLQKPFKPSELLAAVNGSLSSSQLLPSLHGKVPAGIPSEQQ